MLIFFVVYQCFLLKGENGKYYAGYATASLFEIIKATPFPLATSVQQAKLYVLAQACILTMGKTETIILTGGMPLKYHITLEDCGNRGFLTCSAEKN